MPAVDEDRQLDGARPAEVHERVHRRPRGAAVVDDVVDEDHHLAIHIGHARDRSVRRLTEVAVVAMPARVQRTHRDRRAFQARQLRREPASKVVALGEHADQDEIIDTAVALRDLMSDSRKGSSDLVRVHHHGFQAPVGDAHPRTLSRRAIRMWRPLWAWRK